MENFCAFVENKAPEPLEIPNIPMMYCNDPFFRARKRLGLHVEMKKPSGAAGKPRSPPTSFEECRKRSRRRGKGMKLQ